MGLANAMVGYSEVVERLMRGLVVEAMGCERRVRGSRRGLLVKA